MQVILMNTNQIKITLTVKCAERGSELRCPEQLVLLRHRPVFVNTGVGTEFEV